MITNQNGYKCYNSMAAKKYYHSMTKSLLSHGKRESRVANMACNEDKFESVIFVGLYI